MKRSEINGIIREGLDFLEEQRFALPPFAYFTQKQWQALGKEYDELRDNHLGWDITDFGSGDFEKEGLLMYTMRSGASKKPEYFKTYSEKLMIAKPLQITPYHMHHEYIEDIVNRGGGELCVSVYNASPEGERLLTDVRISKDGRNFWAPAGSVITLARGESIALNRHTYHSFWGKEGEPVLLIEIAASTALPNDNVFYTPKKRFPPIEEDEEILYPLVSDKRE